MTNIEVKIKLSSEDLLEAVNQLHTSDLEQFVSQVIKLQAQRRAKSLSQSESDLLIKINQEIPVKIQQRYEVLLNKRQAQTLTLDEYQELIELTNNLENVQVQRLEALANLANLRQISLAQVMKDLGIQPPEYV